MADAWTVIGRVRSVNARAREVRIDVRADYARAFEGIAWIHFERGPEGRLRCKVNGTRVEGAGAVVTLGAGLPRDVVGQLRGCTVVALPEDIPAPPDTDWRLNEWPGMVVVGPGGERLGTVDEVFEGPANDAVAVERDGGGRCVLPVIPEVIRAVDLDAGTIEVGDVAPFIVEE